MELEGSGEGTTKRRIVIVDCGELDAEGKQINMPAVEEQAPAATGVRSETGVGGGGGGEAENEEEEEGPRIEEVGEEEDDGPVLEDEPTPDAVKDLAAKTKAVVLEQENEDDGEDGPQLEVQ